MSPLLISLLVSAFPAVAGTFQAAEGECSGGGGRCTDGAEEDEASLVQIALPRQPIRSSPAPVESAKAAEVAAENEAREANLGESAGDSPACALTYYQAKYALPANAAADGLAPPMVVGTEENMDARLKDLGMDFTGIWWMRGNPVPEELASFAYLTVNSSSFPARLVVPNNRKGVWSWVNSATGRVLVKYYSTFEPLEPIAFDFESNISGSIGTSLKTLPLVWVEDFPFIYINVDEWLRPSIFQEGSLVPDTNYTLTRIIKADGSPHPLFWPLFMDHMTSDPWFSRGVAGEKEMISMNSDNGCMRKCQIALNCYLCQKACR